MSSEENIKDTRTHTIPCDEENCDEVITGVGDTPEAAVMDARCSLAEHKMFEH